ncbi:DNA polymerase I [Bartonella sp. DGB1]|uniref:DNA polymerase I n=1 Tax=Bartonella sp. DGB1 TaxID=3239807 RepID=UPI003526BF41
MSKKKRIFLIDGSGYIFRSYYALPPLFRKKDGLPVSAVVGFCNMLWKLFTDIKKTELDSIHIAVIFDHSSKNFRHDIYPDYKIHRPELPSDLIPQFSLIRQATKAFGIACIEKNGFEADDIIATYTRMGLEEGAEIRIISSDKDLLQLVNSHVSMYDSLKNNLIGIEEVKQKWGVPPERMIDLQSLVGDSSDGIPGVPGIGPKTAALLLNEFGSLDNLLNNLHSIKQPKRREALLNNIEKIKLAKKLVTLDQYVDLDKSLDHLCLPEINGVALVAFLKAIEVTTLTKRVAAATGCYIENIEAADIIVDWVKPEVESKQEDFSDNNQQLSLSFAHQADNRKISEKIQSNLINIDFNYQNYKIINSEDELILWLNKAKDQGYLSFNIITDNLDSIDANMLGFSIALTAGEAAYIPLQHIDPLSNEKLENQLPMSIVLNILKQYLEDDSILVIMQNAKYNMHIMYKNNINIAAFDDTILMGYILANGLISCNLEELTAKYLSYTSTISKEISNNKIYKNFATVDLEHASVYIAEISDMILRLWFILKQLLIEEKKLQIYERIDKPLVKSLLFMEIAGVKVDVQLLDNLSEELTIITANLEQEIYAMSDTDFNLASPKQLGEILFEKLKLPLGKKTKTGQWQTSLQILEELNLAGFEIAQKIIDWRHATKLKTTYTDALPAYINKESGRIHTNYSMSLTSTARLSSNNPNLQNIPIRHELGKKIRRAFISKSGYSFISADYSQIELRILAEMANIPALKEAFRKNIDIHSLTATEIFSISLDKVTADHRRKAKAINFGIIYGISSFGLSKQLSIPNKEADLYIKYYFERFPQILSYMEDIKRYVSKKGYVKTLFGRRMYFPNLLNSKSALKAGYERAAINATLQGTAADIIRRAMFLVDNKLKEQNLDIKMLLQVHDELIFEVKDEEISIAERIIKNTMENATFPYLTNNLNLKVDVNHAKNWGDAH